jgi:FkbM family methyltransferase
MKEVKVKINDNNVFDMYIPEWFIENRGDMGITFKDQIEKFGHINLPIAYRKIYDFVRQYKDLTFVDVGANIGLSTIPLSKEGFNVISIEPLKENIDILIKNKNNLNLNYQIIPCAIGDKEGSTEIYTGEQTDCASILIQSVKVINDKNERSEIVEIKRLDSLVDGDNFFIKIDVQGYEQKVLNSMEGIFNSKKIPFILIEMDNNFLKNDNVSTESINNYLINKKYKPYNFHGDDILYIRDEN